jgi:hypothetical protein
VGATVNVTFKAYPWAPHGGDLNAINPILGKVVACLCDQKVVIPPDASTKQWYETGLTAMLRAIDTVRATLDPSYNTPDHKIGLLGEPILVMAGRLKLETTAETDPKKIAQGPSPLEATPAIPLISVRIGDITRPDDGVLGFFTPTNGFSTPADQQIISHFAPVSQDAAKHAILNGLTAEIAYTDKNGLAVTHPFVKNQPNVMPIAADTPQDVIMLTDIRGDIYATCGVLPRKSITIPKEFLDASLANMEPVFRVRHVFSLGGTQDVKPLFPPPQVQGYDARFAYGSDGTSDAAMPPSSPTGDLPPTRVTLNQGWVKLHKRTKAE